MSSLLLWAGLLILLMPMLASARDAELRIPDQGNEPEAWLLTYAPGESYWQRFGHNAIWIRDRDTGIDHAFNFGFFDFNQERFLTRFIQGRMLYFSAAQPAGQEFAQYRAENRTISALKLNLPPQAFIRLRDHLVNHVQPENREYLYDYYLDNCSTRVRDALDFALNGTLSDQTRQMAASQNFRAQTRRSVSMDFWYYLGLESALALPIDREITRWDEMFLPSVVADVVMAFEIDGMPLATDHQLVFQGNPAQPPETAPALWWRYLLVSVLITGLILVIGALAGPAMNGGTALAWLLLNGSAGLVLLALWTLTDHQVAGPNANLLLLSPLFLIGLWPRGRWLASVLIILGLLVSLLMALWPGGQYNLDILAFTAPLNVACVLWLWRQALV